MFMTDPGIEITKDADRISRFQHDIAERAVEVFGARAARCWLNQVLIDGKQTLKPVTHTSEYDAIGPYWAVLHRDIDARETLLRAALIKLRSKDKALLWVDSTHPKLGNRSPQEVCFEPGGLERCRGLLR
jgi:uncharacterized protein (DUF2384 family)